MPTPHLFVDISSHGFGHLAQVAPILNELARQRPDLRLSVRSGLSPEKLRARVQCNFTHIPGRSDFGYVMLDAVRIDHAASATAYRDQHRNWQQRVAAEACLLRHVKPDLLLSDVAYLPLAGAAQAGIPSLAMCSLNWADLFAHFYGNQPWAPAIHHEMLAAYGAAECFLRLTPAMPMADFPRTRAIAPVAASACDRRAELLAQLPCAPDSRLVLVAFGGFSKDLAAARWPYAKGVHYLVPQSWSPARDDMSASEPLGLPFNELLGSVDAVLTKPGYGSFTEAACSGTAVVYLRRDDWPEQDCLIDWLQLNARCLEISEADLLRSDWPARLDGLWQQASPARPRPDGVGEVASLLAERLSHA